VDNERSGQQERFLKTQVGVHPVSTRRLQRKVIPFAALGRNSRLRQTRYAVLIIRWMQAMPMNRSRHRELIFEQNVKRLIDHQGHPLFTARLL
jgi:hypothetical protein